MTRPTLEERFWSKVRRADGDNCWEWQAGRNAKGYGTFRVGEKTVLAHRLAFEMCVRTLDDEELACHHCDNPACVRPSHLFAGTVSDNVQDMMRKGRNVPLPGEMNGSRKLSEPAVQQIRDEYPTVRSYRKLAARHGVSFATVRNIVKEQSWR